MVRTSGGSSDIDEDGAETPKPEAPKPPLQQQQQQQQGKENVDELMEDFFTYFNTTFPDTIQPLLKAEDLGSRRALLGHVKTARRKLDQIRKVGKDTLSLGDKIYVSFVINLLRLINAVLEKEIQLSVELEQEIGGTNTDESTLPKQWLQENDQQAGQTSILEAQTEEELLQALSEMESRDEAGAQEAAERANNSGRPQMWATAVAAASFAGAITWTAQLVGLDVGAHVGPPENPFSFAFETLLWTLPLAAVARPFWKYAYAADTDAGVAYRQSLNDKDNVLEQLSTAEIWGFCALLETGGGLLFRGTVLSLVTLAVAGIPDMHQEAPDLYLASQDVAVHFPTLWMWPFVAIATGAAEAALVQSSLGGFKDHRSTEFLEEEASMALLQAMTLAELEASTGDQEGPTAPSVWKETGDTQMFQIALPEVQEPLLTASDVNSFVKKLPLNTILNFLEAYDETLRTSGPVLLHIPMLFFAKGTLMSAESILTGNVWSSIITATVLTAIEEITAKEYLESVAQANDGQQPENKL